MIKKFLAAIIAALLFSFGVSLLFATGAQEEQKETGVVQIQFWHSWAPDGPQGKVLQKLLNEFNASQDKVFVMPVFMGEKRNEKIAAALASGNAPDIAWISGAGEKYYEAGQLLPMSEVYDKGIINRNDIIAGLLKNMAFLGKDITIPFENSNLALYYNKDMLAEKGVAFPPAEIGKYTWKDFIRDAKLYSDPANGKWGWDPRLNTAMLSVMFWEAGGEFLTPDMKKNLICSDPHMKQLMIKALNRIYDMLWKSQITAPKVGDQGFNNGDMPFEITGPWAMPRYTKPAGKFEEKQIGIAPMPADADTGKSISYWYQKALALFKTNTRKEQATLQFIKWFYSPEVHGRWCAQAGYIPITISGMKSKAWNEFAQKHSYVDVFLKQAPIMRRRPSGIPMGNLGLLLDVVKYKKGTPEDAIKQYCQDAQLLLDDFWARH